MMIYNTHNIRIDPVIFPLKYAKVFCWGLRKEKRRDFHFYDTQFVMEMEQT